MQDDGSQQCVRLVCSSRLTKIRMLSTWQDQEEESMIFGPQEDLQHKWQVIYCVYIFLFVILICLGFFFFFLATMVAVFLVMSGLLLFLGGSGTEGLARMLLGCVFFVTSSDNLAVWPRDLVLMRHRHRLSDKTIVIGLKSVVDESCPPRNSWLMVRGNITGGGFIIQGLANGKTRVSFVSQANFGGWAGVYGSYGMHVEQMALLISLKNHVHAEIAAVALPAVSSGGPVVATPSTATVTNGFDAKTEELPRLQQYDQNSVSPGTGFFMADVSSGPKLMQVVSQTPDPFRSNGTSNNDGGNNNNNNNNSSSSSMLSAAIKNNSKNNNILSISMNQEISPIKRKPFLVSTDLGDSEEDPVSDVAKLSSFPLRVSYELPRPAQYTEQALQNREIALRVCQEGPADGWVQLTSSKVSFMQNLVPFF